MNCQIVVCPGCNDGAELERSLRDLASLHPRVPSVSIVPVGLTRHREGLAPLVPFDRQRALELIDQTAALNAEFQKNLNTRLAFCADELFIKAGLPIPPEEYYEGYPQIENGVGLLRSLITEFNSSERPAVSLPMSVATGVAAAPFIAELAAGVNPGCRVWPIKNEFFGETVDVAGLVTGGDLITQLRGKPLGERLLIPAVMLRQGGEVFLDDVTLAEASAALGVKIIPVQNDGALLKAALAGAEGANK